VKRRTNTILLLASVAFYAGWMGRGLYLPPCEVVAIEVVIPQDPLCQAAWATMMDHMPAVERIAYEGIASETDRDVAEAACCLVITEFNHRKECGHGG